MRSDPVVFEKYAADCRRVAAATSDPVLKELYDDLAGQWTHLAATVRALEVDARDRDAFFSSRESGDNGGNAPPPGATVLRTRLRLARFRRLCLKPHTWLTEEAPWFRPGIGLHALVSPLLDGLRWINDVYATPLLIQRQPMAANSDGAILAAETLERIARSQAQTYRLQADRAPGLDDRHHFLHLARVHDAIADTQRHMIGSLHQFRSFMKNKRNEEIFYLGNFRATRTATEAHPPAGMKHPPEITESRSQFLSQLRIDRDRIAVEVATATPNLAAPA